MLLFIMAFFLEKWTFNRLPHDLEYGFQLWWSRYKLRFSVSFKVGQGVKLIFQDRSKKLLNKNTAISFIDKTRDKFLVHSDLLLTGRKTFTVGRFFSIIFLAYLLPDPFTYLNDSKPVQKHFQNLKFWAKPATQNSIPLLLSPSSSRIFLFATLLSLKLTLEFHTENGSAKIKDKIESGIC